MNGHKNILNIFNESELFVLHYQNRVASYWGESILNTTEEIAHVDRVIDQPSYQLKHPDIPFTTIQADSNSDISLLHWFTKDTSPTAKERCFIDFVTFVPPSQSTNHNVFTFNFNNSITNFRFFSRLGMGANTSDGVTFTIYTVSTDGVETILYNINTGAYNTADYTL